MPVVDSVPLIVTGKPKVTCETPADEGAVTAKLLADTADAPVPASDITCVFAPVLVKEMLLKAMELRPTPGIMLALEPVKTIEEVPALNESPVLVEKFIPVPFMLNVTVELPRLIVRVLLVVDNRDEAVTLKLLVLKVPAKRLIAPETVKASAKSKTSPVPENVNNPNDFPLLVMVAGSAIVTVPVWVKVMPTDKVTLPFIVILADPVNVPVNPVQLILLAPVLPPEIVQVPVERLVKNTSSTLVGTDAPPAPPDVVAHLVPAVPSQLAVPPTQ